ncbi:MAG: energy-coupling factor transporter transmembrane component T family protein [Actinomycetales bacterium]
MTVVGLYRPGSSVLHRARPGVKLAALLVLTSALVLWRTPPMLAAGACVVVVGYLMAGFGPRVLASQVWPLRWILLVLIPFQVITAGWTGAVVIVGTLVVCVAGAALLTLTTPVARLIDTFTWLAGPARVVGLKPERFGLAAALVVRSIPALLDIVATVRDARRARGAQRSPRALLVPVVVRTVRYAHDTADALAARGLDE